MARKWAKPFSKAPWEERPKSGAVRLRNRADKALHNHESSPYIVYAGYSTTAPHYHLFKCTRLSDPPRRVVNLIPFDRMRFSEDSKARRGGCSMRHCPSDATMMTEKGNQAYCETHAAQQVPCPWTSIESCARVIQLEDGRPCPTCRAFEKRGQP